MHAEVNRAWPRALGTTPMGMARALTVHSRGRGVRYRWRLCRAAGPAGRRAGAVGSAGRSPCWSAGHPEALGADRGGSGDLLPC